LKDRFNKASRQKHTLSDNTAFANKAKGNEEVIPLEESEHRLAEF